MVSQPESVIVVGGGLAGLAAATRILDSGYREDLLLLEKSPTLGGRAGTIEYDGRVLDIGQHMYVSGFQFYLDFVKTIGLGGALRTQEKLDAEFRDSSGASGEVRGSKLPPPFHLAPSLLTFPFISTIDKFSLIGPAVSALLFDYRKTDDEVSFGNWLRKKGATEGSIEKLWNQIVVPTLNARVDDVSLPMGMMILKRVLLDRKGGKLGRLNGSLSRIGESATRFIESRGGELRTGSLVKSIELEEDGDRIVRMKDGSVEKAETIISAIPGHRLEKVLSESTREKFHNHFWNMNWNSIVNVHLFFEDSVMGREFFGYLDGSAGWVFNVSWNGPESGKHICLTISDPGELAEMPSEDLVDLVEEQLSAPLPEIRRTSRRDSIVIYQPRATFEPSPGSHSLRPPQNPEPSGLLLAGDWTDTGWPSTMESAIRSGYFAAHEFLKA